MSAHELDISEDHPLALELTSLRASVARYQHEAHTESVKLQRHSLEASEALERSHALERENARLYEEIRALRANPDLTPHPATLQVPELSLALRRLSDKLTYTEETLLSRTNELVQSHNELAKAQSEATTAQELAERAREREKEGKARERDLERKARAAEEEAKLANLALQEYADLVRNLEGRQSKLSAAPGQPSGTSNATPAESFAEEKSGLQKLLGEFNGETERLSLEISRLQAENESLKAKLESERVVANADRKHLAEVSLELDQYKADDDTAAKMVSRYMKFSQSTTDSLQEAMESLRQRHNAAVTTLELRLHNLHKALHSERRQAEKLRNALDELSEDISREAFGRRREISLRLAFLTREEGLAESLRRWVRKSREAFGRSFSLEGTDKDSHLREICNKVISDAEALLGDLNGQPALDDASPGSVARLLLAQDSVASLTRELQQETQRRIEAQRLLAHLELAAEALVDGAHHVPDIPRTPPPRSTHSLIKLNGSLKTERREPLARSVTLVDAPVIDKKTADDKEAQQDDYIRISPDIPSIISTESLAIPKQEERPMLPPKDTFTLEPLELDHIHPQQPAIQTHDLQEDVSSQTIDIGDEDQEPADVIITEKPTAQENRQFVLPIAATSSSEHFVYQPTPLVAIQTPAHTPVAVHESPRSALYHLDSPRQLLANPTAPLASPDVDFKSEIVQHVADTPIFVETESIMAVHPPSLSLPDFKQPLLAELATVKSRYDELQKAFRDCNLALKELRKDLALLPPGTDAVVRTAVDRLDDYSEDARVELEIRLADEERIITGYRTLLTVPDAISDEVDENEMLHEIKMFLDGTDPTVSRSLCQFSRKLDDLQHDVASVKRYVYELTASDEESTPPKQVQSWSSWTAGILGGSRPVSPAPIPTFGAVMTSPRARQASFSLHKSSSRPALSALFSPDERENPFSALDLRIPMPAHPPPPPSPSRNGLFAVGSRMPRARIASAPIYTLGLGARSSSFSMVSTPLELPQSRFTPKMEEDSHSFGAEESLDSDVE